MQDDDLQINMTLNADDYLENIKQVINQTSEFKNVLDETRRIIESQQKINMVLRVKADTREVIEGTSEIKNNLKQAALGQTIKIDAQDLAKPKLIDTARRINEFSKKPQKIVLEAVDNTKKNVEAVKDNLSKIKALKSSSREQHEKGYPNKSNSREIKSGEAKEKGSIISKAGSEENSLDIQKLISGISKLAGNKAQYKKILDPINKLVSDKDKSIKEAVNIVKALKDGNVGEALKGVDNFKVGNKGWQDVVSKVSKSSKIKGAPKEALDTIMQVVKNSKSIKASDKDASKVKSIVDSLKKGVKSVGINIPALDKLDGGKLGQQFAELKKQIKVIDPIFKKLEKTKAFSKIEKDISSLNSGKIKKVVDVFKDIGKQPEKIEKAFKKVGNVINPFSKAIKSISSLGSKKLSLSSIFETGSKAIPEAKKGFDELKSLIDGLGSKSKTVKKFSDEFKSHISSIGGVLKSGLLKVATTVGSSIIRVMQSVFAVFAANPIVLAITAIIGACVLLYEAWTHNWGGIRDKAKAVVDEIKKIWKGLTDFLAHPIKATVNFFKGIFGGKTDGSHATGLNYVPYNGYVAELHEGERVLTAQQNRTMANGFGGVQISKLAETIVVREEADIDKIANALARKIHQVAFNM